MRRVGVVAALIFASVAMAGSSRGRLTSPPATASAISAVQYTTGDQTYYVDPTGNDGNLCTSTGTAACLTPQGAINKSPKMLRHKLTVNLAAGSYAGFTVSGFTIDPSVQRATAGILIDGALANVTPTTGSATGTATAGTAGSGSTFGTLTDGAATWTTNDAALVGKLLVITGGTGSGQVRVIVSNTATVLTIAGFWTAPTGTSTYALQSPSVNITSAAALVPRPASNPLFGATVLSAAGIQLVDNVTGASNIVVRNIGVAIAATTGILAVNSGSVEITQVVTSGTTSQAGVDAAGGDLIMTLSSVSSTSGIGVILSNVGSVKSGPSTVAGVFYSLVKTTTAAEGIQFTNGTAVGFGGLQLNSTVGVLATNGGRATNTFGVRCDCNSAASSACFAAGAIPIGYASDTSGSISSAAPVDVTNCSYGFSASGLSAISSAAANVLSGNALTYAVNAVYGGSIVLPTASATITGGTAEMSVDTGTSTAAFSTLAASFNCLTNAATTSRICRL